MFTTIGVLAHVDAGKTTFSEQILYYTKGIQQRGRVDHQDAFLDNHVLERQRGITIFAEQGRFKVGEQVYHLIDTPGHVDFSPEMERAISVMDYAIVLVSAVEGVQGHTETVWRLLRKYHIPTFFFINKVDREGAMVHDVQRQLQSLTSQLFCMEEAMTNTHIPIALQEWLAEQDEGLLEAYLTEGLSTAQCLMTLRQLIKNEQAFLCFHGSALKDIGIETFIQQIILVMTTCYETSAPFYADVFKIRHEGNQRLTFMKARQGKLCVRDELHLASETEKVTEIRVYNGENFDAVPCVCAGDLFAVKGLQQAKIGDTIGETYQTSTYELEPTLQARVQYTGEQHIKDVLHIFRLLESEEPSLQVVWHETLQEIHVQIMGIIQLEVMTVILQQRFNLQVAFNEPTILYKETIEQSVIGYGHFEPLKHYAEVHLQLSPNQRGQGNTFITTCHVDELSLNYQRLIEQHLFERQHNGVLIGAAITDIQFTLLTGRADIKHTAGGDFREATFRALRQGLEQITPILLEPYYRFKMKMPSEVIGRVMTDIQQASGEFEPPLLTEREAQLTGRVPVATFMHYSTHFAAMTNGKGVLTLQADGYDVCHNTEEVIALSQYDKNADPLYTSSSMFCTKGKGYAVPWHEAEAAMHCIKK
ncbi:tetracycline resistance protein [Lysinibacillus alkalisoli]|uniref:Tetracycline resistance protein n=1 Tax=Lysinibacillus alkalisoli TaxID=1911548 RepID=A0A917G8W0_9BACI|nr:TetM/TetW/TetO/TetS family tetracycline resistance ribosomal protection protein [Lysinibacillus alkalisoli]GGG29825.1 tetracycline resistance protein [Lysinibacillus alkalisoli]